jgi:hypothetical protein
MPMYLSALQSRPLTKLYVVCMFSGTGTLPFSSRYVCDLIAMDMWILLRETGTVRISGCSLSVGLVLVVAQFLPGVPVSVAAV